MDSFSEEDIERFESYIDRSGEHWLWTGTTDPTKKNYGVIRIKKKTYLVHRVMWMICNGPIPDELTVDHICNVKLCVFLGHLQLLTVSENKLRAVGDTCPSGHSYSGDNLYIAKNGARVCRTCKRNWAYNDYQRKKQ